MVKGNSMCIRTLEKASIRWVWRHWDKYRGIYGPIKILSFTLISVFLAYRTSPVGAGLPNQVVIQSWLVRNTVVVLFMIAWPFLTQIIEKLYCWRLDIVKASDDLSHDDWMFFAVAINNVVGQKSKRFADFIVTPDTSTGDIFLEITQPGIQITSLISGLYAFIQNVTRDKTLKIVLAVIDNNKPVDWRVYLPMDKVPSKTLLEQADQTLFAYCACNREKVAVPDIAKELRREDSRYALGANPRDMKGSILCYPIEHSYKDNRVIYALSIKSEKVNVFNDDFITRYDYIIDSFITRLVLETNLNDLKVGVACDG